MTAGAERVAQTDPHGFVVSLVSVFVVFFSLLILYGVYTLIGKMVQKAELKAAGEWIPRRLRKKNAGKLPDAETAAAISMALRAELGNDTDIAIATALALYLGQSVHDEESGVVSISRQYSPWSDKTLTFRKLPRK